MPPDDGTLEQGTDSLSANASVGSDSREEDYTQSGMRESVRATAELPDWARPDELRQGATWEYDTTNSRASVIEPISFDAWCRLWSHS